MINDKNNKKFIQYAKINLDEKSIILHNLNMIKNG